MTNKASNILALAVLAVYGAAAFYAGQTTKAPVVVTKQVFVERQVPIFAKTTKQMSKPQFDMLVAAIDEKQLRAR